MKNAGQYEKLVHKLLGSMPKAKPPQPVSDEESCPSSSCRS